MKRQKTFQMQSTQMLNYETFLTANVTIKTVWIHWLDYAQDTGDINWSNVVDLMYDSYFPTVHLRISGGSLPKTKSKHTPWTGNQKLKTIYYAQCCNKKQL